MSISEERKEKIKKKSLEILQKNRKEKNGFQYTAPALKTYPYQWLWDSCFHAIILSHFDTEDAKKEIRSLLSRQSENGMIPHIIYWEKDENNKVRADIKWGKGDVSSITQPPLVAQAVWEIYKKDEDKTFLKEVYSELYHYYSYILNERDPRKYHLAGIINPDESGEDNSPRFDILLKLPPKQTRDDNFAKRLILVDQLKSCNFDAPFCMKDFFWVKDVPFNAVLVKNLEILSEISEVLDYKEESFFFEEQSLRISRAMRDRMLEDGLFWSTYGKNYEKIKVKTWAIFAPMFAKILSQEEAEKLVRDYLLNEKEFKTSFMTPSVSKSEPSFNPKGFWRGPSWIAINWFIFKGLLNYGLTDVAYDILEDSVELLEGAGFREFFDPDTGEGLGADDFTWGALVVDMIDSF